MMKAISILSTFYYISVIKLESTVNVYIFAHVSRLRRAPQTLHPPKHTDSPTLTLVYVRRVSVAASVCKPQHQMGGN